MTRRFPASGFVPLFLALSGFAALGYQLCWIRGATVFYGSTMGALSTVTAAFFAGMGLGAYLIGKASVRFSHPMMIYGALEMAVGLLTVFTFPLLQFSHSIMGALYPLLQANPMLLLMARLLLIFVVVMPASTLIGGVFPLLCQVTADQDPYSGQGSISLLYAVNTFGAFAGCAVFGMVLIPHAGVFAANLVNCGISMLLGGAGLLLGMISGIKADGKPFIVEHLSLSSGGPKESRFLPADAVPLAVLYVLVSLNGFTALGLEVLWVRFLSLVIKVTAYTYVFSLSAILLGIALGSLLSRRAYCHKPALLFGIVNIALGIAVALTLLRPVTMWNWVHDSQSLFIQAMFCLALFFIPSLLMGVSFPLAMFMAQTDNARYGKRVGAFLSASTLGGIIGSLGVGFVLLPYIGIHYTLLVITNLSILTGNIAILIAGKRRAIGANMALCGAGLAVWSFAWVSAEVRLPNSFLARYGALLEVKEGGSSFLSVIRSGEETRLEIDGMWQGQKRKDYQILSAHIPMILHPAPKRVLVVGVGTGQAAQRFLLYDIDFLDCADIEKELPGMIRRHFDGAWLDDPRVTYLPEDGRMVLEYSAAAYDVISIEAGQMFRPQAAALYSIDFYNIAKNRLAEDGLVCQFLPIGYFSKRELSSAIRTFIEVFPESSLWFNKHAEFILIGSLAAKPMLTKQRLRLLQVGTKIGDDLSISLTEDSSRRQNQLECFAANYLMGSKGLRELARGGKVFRDDVPELEYRTARIPYAPSRFHETIQGLLESPGSVIDPSYRTQIEGAAKEIQETNVRSALAK